MELLLLEELENLATQCESSPSLLEPSRLRQRFDALDRLDGLLGDGDAVPAGPRAIDPESWRRLLTVRAQLEALNDALYRSVRTEVQQGSRPALFARLLSEDADPVGGLSFDYLDEVVSGVLAIQEPDPLPAHPPEGMVFYQPTPARHILHLLRLTALADADILIDLGSGLGYVSLLASICTGARAIGIEREATYVASARQCSQQLRLERVSFLEQDARGADLSRGTVFYLYTPFTGAILADVLSRLQARSKSHPIRICTFGPCTESVAKERWLESHGRPDPDHITVFRSRG